MDSKKKQEFEQNLAFMRDVTPAIWWVYYQGSIDQGFTPEQAFALVTTYILSQGPNGARPDNPFTPKKENDE